MKDDFVETETTRKELNIQSAFMLEQGTRFIYDLDIEVVAPPNLVGAKSIHAE